MTQIQQEQYSGVFIKFVFVLFCCMSGGAFVYLSGIDQKASHPGISPLILNLGSILLAVVLLASLWLGMRGKQSESWAVLSYGSWMTMPCTMFAYCLWYSRNSFEGAWPWYLIVGAFIVLLILGGIRIALLGQWAKVGLWWLGSLLLLAFLSLLYSCVNDEDFQEDYKHAEHMQSSAVVIPAGQAALQRKAP